MAIDDINPGALDGPLSDEAMAALRARLAAYSTPIFKEDVVALQRGMARAVRHDPNESHFVLRNVIVRGNNSPGWTIHTEGTGAFPFNAGAPGETLGPDCSTCGGTGEVVDYPPEDDERLIACGRCGGTGEAIR